MKANIVLLPGDGIGPEVVNEARLVLDAVAAKFGHEFQYSTHLLGGCAIDATGTAMPEATLAACKAAAAVLLGAVGGPKWDDPQSPVRPEQGLLAIRKGLGLYANLRPVKAIPSLAKLSPLKPERVAGVDFVVIRELTGGLYFGQPKGRTQTPEGERAVDTLIYTEHEIRRIVRLGFELARKRRKFLTSIDKANVLESSRLWRKIAIEIGKEYPDVKLEHQLVDSAAMRLITHAAQFDVIVTENMFGDILTDEAAVLAGSLGLLPSASLGEGTLGLYEPIHGSAPDIAGKGIANPTGTILSAAMLLRHSLGLEKEAAAVEAAVAATIDAGKLTADLGTATPLNTTQMGAAIRERL
ncbi:3-isopropylmalate dehydrogenase [Oleiharenicola lentus]|uniref:3-isopropylmalate dehydrogenase n=1 Tax=Oleiharenicola lentus TaxID=2508720 RepID=UPI003F67E5F5